MKSLRNLVAAPSCAILLLGCAAAMVPETSDPAKKLGWATVLFEQQDRPLPAERLIREAIEIYTTQNDDAGLAEGYRKYGSFLRSAAVNRYEDVYRKDGFLDKSVTFDHRLDKSIEYLSKARNLFANSKSYDKLSNVDLNLAWVYEDQKDRESACKALDSSLANNVQFMAANPDAKIKMPGKYGSFAEVIAAEKKRANCP